MTVTGFTIVRNAIKLSYPFLESVRSLAPLCDEVVIGLGDSTDGTEKLKAILDAEFPGKLRWLLSNRAEIAQRADAAWAHAGALPRWQDAAQKIAAVLQDVSLQKANA